MLLIVDAQNNPSPQNKADQPLKQVQQIRRGKAQEHSFLKSSSRHVSEVLRVISAAVVIVSFVAREGRNIV